MSTVETILQQFKQREASIKAECAKIDKQMNERRAQDEEAQRTALAALEKKREQLARLTAEYRALDDSMMAQAAESAANATATAEAAKDGRAALAEILERREREKQNREAATAKLADVRRVIRALAAEILELERDEAQARVGLRYSMTYPARTQTTKLKAEIETLERGIGCVLEGYAQADQDRDTATNDLALVAGRFIYGRVWENLSFDELRALRLDPRIHEGFLLDLEKIIDRARPGALYHVTLRSAMQNPGGGAALTYREEIPEGMTPTTTLTAEK